MDGCFGVVERKREIEDRMAANDDGDWGGL